jgi:hypothetical protein
MTSVAPVYNLTITQGATFRLRVRLPFDCSMVEAYAQVWDKRRTTKLLDFAVEWIERQEVVPDTDPVEYRGVLDLVAAWDETVALPGVGKKITEVGIWDLLVVRDDNCEREFWLQGVVFVDPRATEADLVECGP